MTELRPDPEALLAAVQKQEASEQRGRLKIFFGMAAGVGKTYAMLEMARQLADAGADIVVGIVETHERAETKALLEGLEVIPRLAVDYRDVTLSEMDLEAILARKPQIVLVDELAHTNAPGMRHAKRYQDVLELLDAGIDVWTTINVQHFESRADAVRQITGATVHETVPDTLLEMANEIELIDLSPEELRKRLAEGKVYAPERGGVAANNFFRVGNLTALREMALRLTAEHVDHQLQDYMHLKRIAGPWQSGERLLCAVGPSPFSERLIRRTRRIAYNLEATWLAVYVETTRSLSDDAQEQLARNLALARTLGAEVITTTSDDVVEGLVHVARQRNVSQIVAGKPLHPRWPPHLFGGSLVDRLLHVAGGIDIYVISNDTQNEATRQGWSPPQVQHASGRSYGLALLIIAAVNLLNLFAFPALPYLAAGLTGLLAVLLIAVYIGRGPALLAATLSALSWNFFFIQPRLTFAISQPQDILLFLLYFAIAIFAGNLTARIRKQEQLARAGADRATALYTLARATATALTMDELISVAVAQISQVFAAQAAIFLSKDNHLSAQAHAASTLAATARDFSVASWVFDNHKPAGRFTETLPAADALYLPLRTPNRTVGVLGVRLHDDRPLSFDQRTLLETFASQMALGIERELLDEAAAQSAMSHESERLYGTLLNSISHELRTPIAAISGASSSLRNPQSWAQPVVRETLIQDIGAAAARLNRLVENLLDMSRLESGRLTIKREWCDIGDIISVAVRQAGASLQGRPLTLAIQPELPMIQLDFVLIEQVLANLLDNIGNYTPAGTQVRIAARRCNRAIQLELADSGPGIPESELSHVFDKFYRLPDAATGGTGLGLSIARGLVEAHGGTLTAGRAPEGGALFTLCLPINGVAPTAHEAKL